MRLARIGLLFSLRDMLLFAALALVACMAALSPPCAHPDERVCLASVHYYEKHWRLADIRDPDAAQTFSPYGVSRLDQHTLYWDLAGKVAAVDHRILPRWRAPERAFNVLLFAALLVFCLRRGREHPWLFLPLCLSPQVWYLFSYSTSDAWDVALSFVALYEAACDGSLLWRTVLGVSRTSSQAEGGNVDPHPVGKAAGVLFCGVLFGLLSLGKPTVLAAFLVIGVLVVRRLVSLSSQVLRRALPLLGAVVLVAASLHASILLSEHFRYGGLHSEVRKEMAEAMRRADFVPDERGVVEHSSVNLRGRGVPFRDVLMRSEPPFLRTTLASFAGSYGALSYPSPFPWYVAVGLCWTALLACGTVRLLRSRPAAVDILSALALLAVPALLLGASAWHSWTADYQPQGRYLFPSNIAWAAIGALIPTAQKGGGRAARLATCVLIALLLLGLYSFLCYGILPMTRA